MKRNDRDSIRKGLVPFAQGLVSIPEALSVIRQEIESIIRLKERESYMSHNGGLSIDDRISLETALYKYALSEMLHQIRKREKV